jgi:hypothetical protein
MLLVSIISIYCLLCCCCCRCPAADFIYNAALTCWCRAITTLPSLLCPCCTAGFVNDAAAAALLAGKTYMAVEVIMQDMHCCTTTAAAIAAAAAAAADAPTHMAIEAKHHNADGIE